jgi:RNA polymerase sigma factor (sigma-70 family)
MSDAPAWFWGILRGQTTLPVHEANAMATGQLNRVIQHLRGVALLHDDSGLTDGQLLECFIARREEAAFAVLVRRHGPMVLGTCRRLLRNSHDAEDAFQATFLVLVRKAAAVVPRERVGNWLYGVACHAARKAKAAAAKRRAKERQAAERLRPEVPAEEVRHDWRPLLDRELSRLPDKYRLPVVLCDLEGRTRTEVARQLGCPEGTLSSRLATARKTLARRLVRHGLHLSAGALALALAQGVAAAAVPALLVASTIKAAAAGAIAPPVAALTQGVLTRIMYTLGQEKGENEQKVMGPQDFRGSRWPYDNSRPLRGGWCWCNGITSRRVAEALASRPPA